MLLWRHRVQARILFGFSWMEREMSGKESLGCGGSMRGQEEKFRYLIAKAQFSGM